MTIERSAARVKPYNDSKKKKRMCTKSSKWLSRITDRNAFPLQQFYGYGQNFSELKVALTFDHYSYKCASVTGIPIAELQNVSL